VSDLPLDALELEAIQAAIRQAAPTSSAAMNNPVDVQPLALIAADREAAAARPRLAELAQRWARRLTRSLRAFVGDITVDAMGAEVIDARSLTDELRTMWSALLGTSDRGSLAVSFGGELVEAAAARRCGATQIKAGAREPSALALRLFTPVGEAAMTALEQAWAELERVPFLRPLATVDAVAAALGGETVLCATLAVSGSASGRVRILARPSVIMPPAERTPTVPADAATIAAALGAVPVEVRVEVATINMKLSEIGALVPGMQITLPVFIDEPMPIYCGDVLKAWGRPVVTRGVIAVEVAALATPGGGRP
jgi:flagellar motor switch protein FliM